MDSFAISAAQADAIHRVITHIQNQVGVHSVFLSDEGGNVIDYMTAEQQEFDHALAALASGAWAATSEVGRMIGEPGFKSIFHKGERRNILMHAVAPRFMLLAIFENTPTQGLVRLYVEKAAAEIEKVMGEKPAETPAPVAPAASPLNRPPVPQPGKPPAAAPAPAPAGAPAPVAPAKPLNISKPSMDPSGILAKYLQRKKTS